MELVYEPLGSNQGPIPFH